MRVHVDAYVHWCIKEYVMNGSLESTVSTTNLNVHTLLSLTIIVT